MATPLICARHAHKHIRTHTHRVHMCALSFPCLLLMSNFSVCKFTFFVSVFHFKRIFQIRLTGRKAWVRAEREGEEGEGASWPENCWLLKVLLLRSALFSCKPTRFLPAKSCFAFSTAQQLPADARVCHLPLSLSASPSTPMAYNFRGVLLHFDAHLFFNLCAWVALNPKLPQFPPNFHCHLRQALPLFLLRRRGWGMVLPATSTQSVSGPVPVPTPTSFISVVFYSFKHR